MPNAYLQPEKLVGNLPTLGTCPNRLYAKPIYTSHKGFAHNLLGKVAYNSITVKHKVSHPNVCPAR